MKICHLSSVHIPFDMRIFHKECRSLVRAGHEVHLVIGHRGNEIVEGVRLHAVKKEPSLIRRLLLTVFRVYREALRIEADVYHFHDPELVPVGLLLRLRGKKVIYDIHEDYGSWLGFNESIPAWMRGTMARSFSAIEELAVRNFTALITVTPSIQEKFAPLNRKTVMIRNFPLAGELGGDEEPVPWNSREEAAAYIGNITPKRGLNEMIRAVEILKDTRPVRLLMGGDLSPASRCVIEGISPDITRLIDYFGYVSRPRVREILQRSKVGLLILHPERNYLHSYPTKLFEYMSAGIPVVCSDFPLFRELDNGVNCCRFVDPCDPVSIAHAIRSLLENPHEAEAMGKRGRLAAREQYSWETEEKKLLSLYQGLLP